MPPFLPSIPSHPLYLPSTQITERGASNLSTSPTLGASPPLLSTSPFAGPWPMDQDHIYYPPSRGNSGSYQPGGGGAGGGIGSHITPPLRSNILAKHSSGRYSDVWVTAASSIVILHD